MSLIVLISVGATLRPLLINPKILASISPCCGAVAAGDKTQIEQWTMLPHYSDHLSGASVEDLRFSSRHGEHSPVLLFRGDINDEALDFAVDEMSGVGNGRESFEPPFFEAYYHVHNLLYIKPTITNSSRQTEARNSPLPPIHPLTKSTCL